MTTKRPVVLMILDGFGIGAPNESNPIYVAKPKNFAWLASNYPVTSLQASGIAVGLPWGEVGNSEVGHLTLGAGKVVYQYYPKITMAIDDKSFFENPVLKAACEHAKKNNAAINFAGLFSKGNVHASISHLHALMKMAEQEGVPRIKLHLFADGKDSPPKTILDFLKEVPLENIATITGRTYAMNRNENWLLTQKAYDCLVGQGGEVTQDFAASMTNYLQKNPSEEFMLPYRSAQNGAVEEHDALIFFNFREDSILQLTQAFALPGFDKFPTKQFNDLYVATMTRYSEQLASPVVFPADSVEKPLGEVLSEAGLTQLRLAETYKHAHVTFFFNGHREPPFEGEYRVLLPSLPGTHPEEHPELQASALTDRLLEAIQNQAFDFILINYSNADTIAHTGNYDACLAAVKVLDNELGRVLKAVLDTEIILIITSDHGNMEEVISPVTGQLETQHDASPVPFHLVAKEFKGRKFFNFSNLLHETTGILADVAPTILELMSVPQPKEMTGRSLLKDLLPENSIHA